MSLLTFSPEANRLSRNNIVSPPHIPDATITAQEARARAEFADRTGATLSGGTIKKGKS